MFSSLLVLSFFIVGSLSQTPGQPSGSPLSSGPTVSPSGGTEAASGATEQQSEGTGVTEQSSEGSGFSSEQAGSSIPPPPSLGSCTDLKCRNGFHCVLQSAFCWIGTFCTPPTPTCVPACHDPNEVWDSCPSCIANYICGQSLPICLEAPLPCQPRCVCKDSWVRNVDGSCIPIWKCLSNMGSVAGPSSLPAGETGGSLGVAEAGGLTVRGARSSTSST